MSENVKKRCLQDYQDDKKMVKMRFGVKEIKNFDNEINLNLAYSVKQ